MQSYSPRSEANKFQNLNRSITYSSADKDFFVAGTLPGRRGGIEEMQSARGYGESPSARTPPVYGELGTPRSIVSMRVPGDLRD